MYAFAPNFKKYLAVPAQPVSLTAVQETVQFEELVQTDLFDVGAGVFGPDSSMFNVVVE